MVRFMVLVSFTVRVSFRVIQLAILFCNCEVTYTRRNVKLYLHLPHLYTSMVLTFSIAAFYKQSESDDFCSQIRRHGERGADVAWIADQSPGNEHIQHTEPLPPCLPHGGTRPHDSVG